jgi:hypothetical protein
MSTNVLQITDIQALIGVIVFVGTIGIGWGTLKKSVENIDKSLAEMKPDLKNIRERFMIVEDRVKTLWKDEFAPASSPRQLNERGVDILNGSGIKGIIEEKRNELFATLKSKELKNPYDAEQCVLQVVNELKKDAVIVEKLKTGAFSVGADIDTVLFVGGIYLRDLVFPDLGFAIADLDKPRV